MPFILSHSYKSLEQCSDGFGKSNTRSLLESINVQRIICVYSNKGIIVLPMLILCINASFTNNTLSFFISGLKIIPSSVGLDGINQFVFVIDQ